VPGPGKLTMKFEGEDGTVIERRCSNILVGVAMGMYNLDDSIRDFRARVAQLRPRPRLAGLPVDQEHDPEGL
jgi:hypothetical protein